MIAMYEPLVDSIAESKKKMMEGQISLFDAFGAGSIAGGTAENDPAGNDPAAGSFAKPEFQFPPLPEYSQKELLSMEKEVLGIYISGHPLQEVERALKKAVSHTSGQIRELLEEERAAGAEAGETTDGIKVTVGGIVTYRKNKVTKTNNIMAFVTVEDMAGEMELLVFPQILDKFSPLLETEEMVVAEGRLSVRAGDDVKVIAETVRDLRAEALRPPKVYLRLTQSQSAQETKMEEIRGIVKKHSGHSHVFIYVEQPETVKKTASDLGRDYLFDAGSQGLAALEALLGKDNVRLV